MTFLFSFSTVCWLLLRSIFAFQRLAFQCLAFLYFAFLYFAFLYFAFLYFATYGNSTASQTRHPSSFKCT